MWSTSTIHPTSSQRCSSQTSFLDQGVTIKSNLKVYNGTMARRVLFKKQNTASGVLVTTKGEDYVLSARKEVILSAGAFQSPQLLVVLRHRSCQHTQRAWHPDSVRTVWSRPKYVGSRTVWDGVSCGDPHQL